MLKLTRVRSVEKTKQSKLNLRVVALKIINGHGKCSLKKQDTTLLLVNQKVRRFIFQCNVQNCMEEKNYCTYSI